MGGLRLGQHAIYELRALLWEARSEPRLTVREIRVRLAARLGRSVSVGAVVARLGLLRVEGFIGRNNLPLTEPAWPMYLLLDAPEPNLSAIDRVVADFDPEFSRETVTGVFNQVVRLRPSGIGALEDLRRRCLNAGALDVRPLLVLGA